VVALRQVVPQVHDPVVLPRFGGGEGSDGIAHWLASGHPHRCELGGADLDNAGSFGRNVIYGASGRRAIHGRG
jgi:hypothetical protein